MKQSNRDFNLSVLKSVAAILVGYALVIFAMNIPNLPKHWIALATSAASFSCAAYYRWFSKSQDAFQRRYSFAVFVVFGVISLPLALLLWILPLPPRLGLVVSLSMFTGGLLGGILIFWLIRRS